MRLDSNKHNGGTAWGSMLDSTTPHAITPLRRVRAVVLLAGSVRATSLRKTADRFIMDLPVDADKTVLDCWQDQLDDLALQMSVEHLPARVMIDRSSAPPRQTDRPGPTRLQIEHDPLAFRGTGGLVSDVAREYDDDDYLIVANAAQVLLTSLVGLVESMTAQDADVSLLCDSQYRPSGLMLIRCGTLRDIASVGFVDLNEQALPAIAKRHNVKVCRHHQPAGMAIRTRQSYLDAVRAHHQRNNGQNRLTDALPGEDWSATFGIIEPGAHVDPSAVVHDSVVLAGGRVDAGAVLVRSIVGPRGRVGPGESAVDCIAVSHRETSRGLDLLWQN